MKCIFLISNHEEARTVFASESYHLECLRESLWRQTLKNSICERLEQLGKEKINRLLIAGHAPGCFDSSPLYLEEYRSAEAEEIKACCVDPRPRIVAFRKEHGSQLFIIFKQLLNPQQPFKLLDKDFDRLERAFDQIVPDTVRRFYAAFRHELYNVLNVAKGTFELRQAGINTLPPPKLDELRKSAESVFNRAEEALGSKERRLPGAVKGIISEARKRMVFSDQDDAEAFLKWDAGFRIWLRCECDRSLEDPNALP